MTNTNFPGYLTDISARNEALVMKCIYCKLTIKGSRTRFQTFITGEKGLGARVCKLIPDEARHEVYGEQTSAAKQNSSYKLSNAYAVEAAHNARVRCMCVNRISVNVSASPEF